MQYAVVIEQSETGYGAYIPDLPGCVAVGESIDEVKTLLREEQLPIPQPTIRCEYIDV